MNTNEMYQAAIKNMKKSGEYYGVFCFELSNGETIVCSIQPVAGHSVRNKHYRTTYGHKLATAKYAKPISHAKVVELLKNN